MNIKSFITTLCGKLKYNCTVEWYNFWYLILDKKQKNVPKVALIDETIRKIVTEHCSISRFGDGEILLTDNKTIGFQKENVELSKRLSQILQSQEEGHLVCIPDTFSNLNRYNRKARRFWRTHFFLFMNLWDKYLVPGQLYYNSFITRPYMDFASKESSKVWFQNIKQIWDNRDIVFIEGEMSRLGVGNDLFENARSVRRVICPPQNAFAKYDDIVTESCKLDKNILFLIALGPTATVLAYDLFKKGYQAVDIGHIDIEYGWWKIGARRKVKLPQKYINEVSGGDDVPLDAGEEYQKQIISRILPDIK